MNWHKNLVEKSLKSLGMSSYQGMWSAFIKGVVITCILFYFIDFNKNSDDNKIKFEIEYSEKFQEDGFYKIEGIIVGKAIYDGDIKLDELAKEIGA